MASEKDPFIRATKRWLESVVIGLDLCPFAKREFASERVRFSVTGATAEIELLQALESELQLLLGAEQIETTLLVHPCALKGFAEYNQFLGMADGLLTQMNLEGVFQIASFHPDYQFAGTQPDDVENFTNRSPHPTLHILRESSLSRAIDGHPDIDQIPVRNIEKMKSLSPEQLKHLFRR